MMLFVTVYAPQVWGITFALLVRIADRIETETI